ncbi:hypothetical protein BKI52_40075 [marine bacterium AO1-C]|nr:hypothetical protein BKI52_40075 [marine bacterium AO1-C]
MSRHIQKLRVFSVVAWLFLFIGLFSPETIAQDSSKSTTKNTSLQKKEKPTAKVEQKSSGGFFSKKFYGSTIYQWLIALSIILGAVIVGRILYWFFTKIVRIFTEKTETKLDDIIIDKIEEPIVAAIVIAGFWWGISYLSFAEKTRDQIEGFIYLIIILDVAWLIVRTIDGLIEEYIVPLVEESESNLDDAILPIARRGFKVIVWVIAVVVGLNNAGYDVATVLAGLGIGGVALAIGARTTIMNIFGGLSVLINQPFKIGDRILISGHDGYVQEIGLSNTRLRTFIDDFLVTIPNKVFTDKEVVNISAASGVKGVFFLNISTQTPGHKITALTKFLQQLSINHEHLETDNKTTLQEFSDFSVMVRYVFYIKNDAPYWDTKTELGVRIMNYFKENDISFAQRRMTFYAEDAPPPVVEDNDDDKEETGLGF